MNSEKSSRIVNVSLDNIKAQVETLLRTWGTISDREDVEIFFELSHPGKGWDLKGQDKTVVPVHIKIKEEVQLYKINGTKL